MADGALHGIDRALVIGLGRSGQAAVTALRAAGVAVVAVDEQPGAAGAEAAAASGAEVHTGVDPVAHLTEVDLVVPSPGVPERAAVLAAAHAADVPIWSEPELGWRLHPRRLLGITGTNGKTSVTEATTTMLTRSGIDAVACGNIGLPVTAAAADAQRDTVLVAELSSFQLRFTSSLRPEVGVLLNVAADHLDWHGGLDAYARAKARLWQAQTADDWRVASRDDALAAATAAASDSRGRPAWFSGARSADGEPEPGVGVEDGHLVAHLPELTSRLLAVTDLPVQAPHHIANLAAAACAALLAGASTAAVAAVARDFRPGRHRLEVVAAAGGVRWVDDSKATNVHAAAAALAAFAQPEAARTIVWIAGGIAKGVDLTALGDHLDGVRAAVVIGEAADELAAVCADRGVSAIHAASMSAAVAAAAGAAQPGDVVLLAPACSSFDMFDDYADRGDRFAAAARALAGEVPDGRQ